MFRFVLGVALLSCCYIQCASAAWTMTDMNNDEKKYTFENDKLGAKIIAVRLQNVTVDDVDALAKEKSSEMGCTCPIPIGAVGMDGYSFDCSDGRFVYLLKQNGGVNEVTAYCKNADACQKAAEFIKDTFHD